MCVCVCVCVFVPIFTKLISNNDDHESCNPTNDLSSTCSQRKVEDHPVDLGVTCVQHVELPRRCWLTRTELPF